MIESFLSWWGQHLLAWLPAWLRGERRQADALIADVSRGDAVSLIARRGGRETLLGHFELGATGEAELGAALGARRRSPVVVRPPPGTLLQRAIELPLAAERDLGQVLRYEMDRLTPFAPDELHWGWAVERRDRGRGRLHVSLLLAPKTMLAPALAVLRRAGAVLTALETADAVPRAIPLDPGQPGQERRRRLIQTLMAAMCLSLALVAVGLPFVRQEFAARRIEAQIERLRPDVDKAQALRRKVASGTAGADVLANQRAATGNALAVLATVTDVLPDDTYLTELTLHGRVLTLTGQSAAAARLISALSGTPLLRDPSFIAPVTRNEMAKADQFSIRAGLVP